MPFYIGGHTGPALRRAARVGDGWTSAMMKYDDIVSTIAELTKLRAEYGRAAEPFEIQVVCIDRFGKSGYEELAAAGVTDSIVVPWVFDGLGFDSELSAKQDSLRRFADQHIQGAK